MSTNGQAETGHAMWLLRDALAPYVKREVAPCSREGHFQSFLTSNRLEQKSIAEWDVGLLLKLMQHMWRDVFQHVLDPSDRAFVTELQGWRNKWAHQERLSTEDTDRALDSAARLLRAIDAESQADEVTAMRSRLVAPDMRLADQPRVQPNPQPAAGAPRGAVRDLVVHLLMHVDDRGIGMAYGRIAEQVRANIPGARTTAASVACYKQYAKRQSHGISPEQAEAILAIEFRQ